MPSVEKIEQSVLTGTISGFLDKKRSSRARTEQDSNFLNIIDFIERFKLLPYGLFPVQKFLVKLYYSIPLEDKEKTIKITDRFNTKTLYNLTEVEYLHYLHDQGRCNIKEQDERIRNELILVLGRRSGKSTLSALFAVYEMYKLLCRGNPQAYYGLPAGNEILLFCVANDKDQASIVYNEMSGHIEQMDFFKFARANFTQTYIRFRTDADRQKFGERGKATLKATFKSSIAKGLRGRGTILLILDELAFFVDKGNSSGEKVYRAIVPSTAAFSPKDPINRHIPLGPSDGKVVSISSPDAKEGFFYKLYQTSMENSPASRNMLMIQAPTWEVNPTISSDYYEVEYSKDPKKFGTEFGSEFSDRVRGWIEDSKDLTDCIIPDLRPKTRGIPRKPHFAGVDFGIVNDGTSVSITHLNNGKIELAYHEVWYAKKKWKESNPHLEHPLVDYALTLQDRNRLDLDAISEWLKILAKNFFIYKGIFDQWAGPVFEQALHKNGLTQFEQRNFFPTDSSNMYQTFKMFMYNKQLALYDWPVPEAISFDASASVFRHSPLISEILELQASSEGKNISIVEAPKVPGKHDDQSDSIARSVLLASEYIKANPGILEHNVTMSNLPPGGPSTGYHQYLKMRNRMHGVVRERIPPRIQRRR